ncbi:5-amino-6-(5-phosphoribosylamino)uracil reductase [Blastococcus sp. DSM 46786]|uniref:dihydrofolate reductase family protein n=1 Tax=Blastococcus sp. DSM 46786 TaxID=1798227 RepID=UPI0008C58D55|nr:dihydrofolate reductase family protein [Blastococcus sp. DSM 46786]SEL10532.1 5-amino-6-(5-phosphoribosylamino)uracil reductase [Blastococcus sp. DSM 46786]
MRRLLPDPAPLDADGLVEAYRMPPGRSLRVNVIASLDGAITVDGASEGLGSPGDRRVFQVLRALADVVLVGHGTASTEGYRPVLPGSAVGRLRESIGRPPTAPIAVVSRRASLDPASGLVTDAVSPAILITCGAADPDRRAALAAAGADVLVCGDDDVDLPAALAALAARGLEQVTCEGGPQLLRSALSAGVVDELDLSIAPALVGGETRLLDAALGAPARLELRQLLEEDGMLFTRYALGA